MAEMKTFHGFNLVDTDARKSLDNKVDKVTGKSLVADSEITKLSNISSGATKVESSSTNGNIKIDGTETTVYTEVANTVHDANYVHTDNNFTGTYKGYIETNNAKVSNVQADWNATSGLSVILNKPANLGNVDDVQKSDGTSLVTNKIAKLPADLVEDSSYVHTDNNYTTDEKNKLSGVSSSANKVEASSTNGHILIDGTDTTVYTEVANTVHDASYVHTDNNYTTNEKNKLSGISAGANKVEASTTNGNISIDGKDTTVYTEVAGTVHDASYKHIDVTSTSVTDGANTFTKYDDTALSGRVTAIENKIPAEATADNKLADKSFVNSSIATNTSNFVGTFDTLDELKAVENPTNNDYGFVKIVDSTTKLVKQYDRYKYAVATAEWKFEYTLNNSSFTADQWASINSGITATLAGKITTNETAISTHTSDKSNPHKVTKAQVELGNVDNTSDADKPVSTATQTELNKKVDKVYNKSLVLDTEITKLSGVSTGANKVEASDTNGHISIDGTDTTVYTEVANTVHDASYVHTDNNFTDAYKGNIETNNSKVSNVQADWNATEGLAVVLNKPTIPTNNNQLTNGAGYITADGSCSYATTAGSAQPVFNNSTWYLVGDDAYIGDNDQAGAFCVKGATASPSIKLYNQDGSYNSTVITSATISSQSVSYATSAGSATSADSATSASSATSATQDGSGNTITTTYQTITDNSLSTTAKTVVGSINEIQSAMGTQVTYTVTDGNLYITTK